MSTDPHRRAPTLGVPQRGVAATNRSGDRAPSYSGAAARAFVGAGSVRRSQDAGSCVHALRSCNGQVKTAAGSGGRKNVRQQAKQSEARRILWWSGRKASCLLCMTVVGASGILSCMSEATPALERHR